MLSYDYVIAGGGLARLSLACRLAQSSLGEGSMLIVDGQPAALQDRAWSYWADEPTIFDPIITHRWDQLQITSPTLTKLITQPGIHYEMIRGRDLDHFARRKLLANRAVTFQTGTVEKILDGRQGARVIVDGQPIEAKWVFDSTVRPAKNAPARRHGLRLRMQFRGWTVETRIPAFNPQAATFLDFRTRQHNDARFFYVLPFSECRAMVQYVIISATGFDRHGADAALQEYLATTLGIGEYSLTAQEAGSLALSDAIRPRRLGPHVMAIGAKGGLVKPSTGFGFHRIQLDSVAIVRSLLQDGQPWAVPGVSERHRLYDSLLLDVLTKRGSEAQVIFSALFARNPIRRVLRFLDETSTPAEDLELIATLPARPFLEALARRMMARAGL